MAQIDDYRLHRVLTRFPWRRRKPRTGKRGRPAIGYKTREGQQLWADPADLASFEDPGPALVCVAIHGDPSGHALVRSLVRHHASDIGVVLPPTVPDVTRKGLEVLDQLIDRAGLDPTAPVGAHPIREVLAATWAIAAATDEAAPNP
jgi:hypothetical protein